MNKKETLKIASFGAGGLAVGIAATIIAMNCISKTPDSSIKESSTSEITSGVETEIPISNGDKIKVVKVPLNTPESKEEALNKINEVFEYISDKSLYIQVETGNDEFDSYMYSKNGELVAQSYDGSYSIVIRNDMKSVRYNNASYEIAFDSVIDVLGTAKGAIKAVEQDTENVTLERIVLEGDEEYGVYEYAIDFKGSEACKVLFSEYGDEFADKLITEIKSHMGETWEPHLKFGITIDNEKQIGLYMDIIEGDEEYNNWLCNYYVVTEDWQLEDKWYSIELNEENAIEILEMMEFELNKLNEVASKIDDSLFDDSTNTAEENEQGEEQ